MENCNSQFEQKMEKRIERGITKGFHVLFHLIIGGTFVAALGYVVMLLWNWLASGIFGCVAVNYWQALGLFVLCRLLFGGFGFGHHHFKKRRVVHFNHLHEKWAHMTPEERKEFVRKRHLHHFHTSPDSQTSVRQE